MAQQVTGWTLPYHFKKSREGVISHPHNGNLRVSPRNASVLDGAGTDGPLARWQVHLEPQGVNSRLICMLYLYTFIHKI